MGSGDSHLYALNLRNGELLWSYKTNNAVYSSPAISSDDRVVYFGSWDGKVRALDTYSGKLIWEHVAQGAIDSSPTLSSDEETLYVGVWSGNVRDVLELQFALSLSKVLEHTKQNTGTCNLHQYGNSKVDISMW